jgi:DNA-binding transcriptional MerR regulator
MNAPPARGYLSISEVLAQLRPEFPDISTSKIRFLETEGLIEPARSPSGYRRFVAADVARLRYILAAQRDQYLPLRVIKERLAAAEADAEARDGEPGTGRDEGANRRDGGGAGRSADGTGHNGAGTGRNERGGVAELARVTPSGPVGRRELIAATGATDALLTELETHGLLRRQGRVYPAGAIEVTGAVTALMAYGVEARHLRTMQAAAERETALIEQVVAPMLRQRSAAGRELASQTSAELAGLLVRLHATLLAGELAEAGLSARPDERGPVVPGHAIPGQAAPGRAVASASPAGPARAGAAGKIDASRADPARDSGCTLTKGMPASTRGMPVSEVGW